MNKQEVQELAFKLIGYSGEAFNHFFQAIECARLGDFKKAQEEILEGEKNLSIAHRAQTSMLTAEARDEEIEFSIILIHAQDHLMTTIMFERVTQEFIKLYEERKG